MKIRLIWIGKSKEKNYANLTNEFANRLSHYCKYEIIELKDSKKRYNSIEEQKDEEAHTFLQVLSPNDYVILLDENGKSYTSEDFSTYLQHHLNHTSQDICLLIGGAFGFGSAILKRADAKIALSKMTFTHDMARVILLEQLYRAFTILRGEKYHNK
jgi:23S rRNA (pseudouridine1915-N3)-methyltransferase